MKNIEWLNKFAESYAKNVDMKKTAGKLKEDIIVDRDEVSAKVGEVINYNGKLYKVADLSYEDEKGPGVVLSEFGEEETVETQDEFTPTTEDEFTPVAPETPGMTSTEDPMAMAMGTNQVPAGSGSAQEYTRTNPGDVYDNPEIQQQEINKFNNEAEETARNMEKERNFDRSTPEGHFTAPKDMGGSFGTEPAAMETVEETPVMEESTIEEPVMEEPAMDVPTEQEVEELSVDAPLEEPVEECIEDECVEEESLDKDEFESLDKISSKDSFRNNRILRRIMASK